MAGNTPTENGAEKQFLSRLDLTRAEMIKTQPTQEESAIIEEHFQYLKVLTEKGVVKLAGRTLTTGEIPFGLVVFRAESEEAAHAIMDSDPAVKKGVMRATLFPFRVVLMQGM